MLKYSFVLIVSLLLCSIGAAHQIDGVWHRNIEHGYTGNTAASSYKFIYRNPDGTVASDTKAIEVQHRHDANNAYDYTVFNDHQIFHGEGMNGATDRKIPFGDTSASSGDTGGWGHEACAHHGDGKWHSHGDLFTRKVTERVDGSTHLERVWVTDGIVYFGFPENKCPPSPETRRPTFLRDDETLGGTPDSNLPSGGDGSDTPIGDSGDTVFRSIGQTFYGWRHGTPKALIYALEFEKTSEDENAQYFNAIRIEVLYDAEVDMDNLRMRLDNCNADDIIFGFSDVEDTDDTDDRITYTGEIPVCVKGNGSGVSGLGFDYFLYGFTGLESRARDTAITTPHGITTDFNRFTLTRRQIDSELWSEDIPNDWIITEVEQVQSAPSARWTQAMVWGRLKTQ